MTDTNTNESYALDNEQVLDLIASMAQDVDFYENKGSDEKDPDEKAYAYAKADGVRHAWSNLTSAVARAQEARFKKAPTTGEQHG
jgi:hypothetical protein